MRKRKEGNPSGDVEGGGNKENDPLAEFPYPYESGVSSEDLAKNKAKQVRQTLH